MVLSGTAGEQSDINLMLFSDDIKAVLLFLLKHNIEFEDNEWITRIGGHEETVPSYTMTSESGTLIHGIRRRMRILRRWKRCWVIECQVE